jgi:hypothetical protein
MLILEKSVIFVNNGGYHFICKDGINAVFMEILDRWIFK